MPCFHPLKAYRTPRIVRVDSGKSPLFFWKKGKPPPQVACYPGGEHLQVPCGQCWGCRLERSRQWAMRCMHEAQMHESSCFITLTFNEEHIDKNNSLQKHIFVKFMKRLRQALRRSGQAERVRFYHCGEYGETLGRPHHHAIIYGFDFPDKVFLRLNENGDRLYTSEFLAKYWSDPDTEESYGLHVIGSVTFESCAYVARYIMKKVNGDKAKDHYIVFDEQGNANEITPEYTTMSRRPGIGREWYEKYADTDIWTTDTVKIKNGIECKPPKYYSNIYELTNPKEFSIIKANRKAKAEANPHNTPERLAVREKIKLAEGKKLKRILK